ncbi:MAG: SIR2 family protein [Flavobacterium sp.]|nr:SIR2 family protein [Flavobacterium sp.]
MEHILDIDKQAEELNAIFLKIKESNTILFLGAGASVGEKRYLSKEVIEYYESKIGKQLNESNITKWLDILSADDSFSRTHFDNFVHELLQKLIVTEAHRVMAGIPWREIITTNYDLLIERAFDEITASSQKIYDIKPIRNQKQYNYRESNTEVRYIKLNGCVSDKSLYPLAFSSDDFRKLGSFYKLVLNDLKNISYDIQFLSIGYSFTDDFGKELLDKFDSYNFRDKRWILNVDPYPNENSLSYYKKNKICIIKSSFQDFFLKYKEWETKNADIVVKKKGLSLSSSKDYHISAAPQLLLSLDGIVKQLNTHTRERFIKEEEYYKGDEPNFGVITRGLDVIKTKFTHTFTEEIQKVVNEKDGAFVPVFFISGDFGIGKSTFTLRLIYEFEKQTDLDLVAFEIVDFNRARKEHLIDLIKTMKAKNFIFFCDEIEIESYFKSLIEIQRDISIEQFQDCNIFFVAPIRENILEKFKLNRSVPNSHELKISGEFTIEEIEDLLEKLKKSSLIDFRDASEKKRLVSKIMKEYNSDSFVALMSSITSGRHENDLIDCYNQLSKEAQQAFLYTALLHRHKLLMPASWLKQNIKMDWDEFIAKIIKAEGKGILIQEFVTSHGTQPDLYFRTKHSLIADRLVDRFLPNKDKQFQFYEQMLKQIENGQTNSYLANNLLRALGRLREYNNTQIDKLYDAGYTKLSEDPYFLLNYAINLQNRKTKTSVKKAIEHILYAEGLLDYRNHRFIHRRAALNFELAKLFFAEESQLNYTLFYLKEAEELFVLKQLLDPFSAFSYVDYIKLIVWQLENIEYDIEDVMQQQILIEDLFDLANRTVTDNIDRIDSLQTLYANYLNKRTDNKDYKQYLDELYQTARLRPYACILLHNYHLQKEEFEKCDFYIDEMEYMQENFEVVKFLFKIYGRNLHDANTRIKLLRLGRENTQLEKDNPLRYYYFQFMAESYNFNYYDGKNYLNNIQTKYHNLNPEFHYEWKDTDGEVLIFDATVIKNSGERFKAIKISPIQLTARLVKGTYDKFAVGAAVKVKLHFYLYGVMAEIIQLTEEIEE